MNLASGLEPELCLCFAIIMQRTKEDVLNGFFFICFTCCRKTAVAERQTCVGEAEFQETQAKAVETMAQSG